MSMKPNMKLVETTAEPTINQEFDAMIVEARDKRLADAEQDEFADAVAGALHSSMENDGPIKLALAWVDDQVATTSKAVETSQTKIAAAHTAFDNTMAKAIRDRDDIVAEATAKLQRDTRYLASATRFQGDLRQNEL